MATVLAEGIPAPRANPSKHDGTIAWSEFGLIVAQLLLVLLLFRQFQIENSGFLQIAQIAFAGFLIHAFLPLRFRLPFFALLSLAGTALLLGAENFAWLFGIGIVLIGICHIPVSYRMRVALLVLAGAALAVQRAGIWPSPWSEAIWPILGSMFMFRLMVYLYDLQHDKAGTSFSRTIAYFFMLPNASFPLFPVVDYRTFQRNYYDDHAYRIYQRGVDWMVRGIVHLLLYRLVYYYLVLAPAEVTSPELLMQFLVTNFLLYLKVSGLFHLIVGMLYLFGFRLPETHNRYFLAAGFTDLWRRINIYWKDFMQKVFYYPAVFRLKRLGPTRAIIVATLWVFVVTWFLHSYQWFWIRGTALLALQDVLFWVIIGALVIVNSLYEIKHGRKRSLGKAKFSWRAVGLLTLKSYATFWFICLLWSFWTSDKLDDWMAIWDSVRGEWTVGVLLWPAVTLFVLFVGNIPRTKADVESGTGAAHRAWLRDRAVTIATAVLLIGISIEPVFSNFGTGVSTVVHSVRQSGLSRLDAAKMEKGYYEGLTDVTRFNSQLWETYAKRPANWLDNQGAGLKRFVGGFAQTEMIPSFVYVTSFGTITTNRWGLRDVDYAERPAPGTFRAALLGASSVMGWGVSDGETFEALLESRLNAELAGSGFTKYEILNFAVQGYYPPQQLVSFERALALHPNAVMYVATGRELSRSVAYLAEVMHKGIEIPYPRLREIVNKAEVTKGMREAEAQRRLMPFAGDILGFIYGQLAEQARSRRIQPLWVFLPQLREGAWQEETAAFVSIAEKAGFILLRLDDVFKGQDVAKIRLAEWDEHPNAYAHRLIADLLFLKIRENRARIFSYGELESLSSENKTTTSEKKQ
jgi:D-alanyl-lipoteichoic acid acyltransferase DltB (MBOAT superfamily)